MAFRPRLCTLAVPVRTRRRGYRRNYARSGPHINCGYAPGRAVRGRQALPVLGLPLISLIPAAIRQGDRPEGASEYYLVKNILPMAMNYLNNFVYY